MASIISGYNYDIFISYRLKDNKHDGWVTEFVDNLKGELESTFKEEISVYFDINPHDGLLETHDVDESLKEKLKCLIFIPIISRTYCDPKSFAWEHEFKAFVAMASNDQFGLKVKLPNGNVASRVLPVKIHNLAPDDNKMIEGCLDSHLRGIEFTYSEPGVNRPLKPDDDEKINLNRTKYRNQINKAANSISEILNGLQRDGNKTTEPVPVEGNTILSGKSRRPKMKTRKIILASVITLVVISSVFALFFRHDSLQRNKSSGNRIAIVVLPFQNLTGDKDKDYWQTAIQENITTFLSNFQNDIIIRQISTVNPLIESQGKVEYSSISNSLARKISGNLGANLYVTGSIQLAGKDYRVSAKLIEVETSMVLKPFEISIERSDAALTEISDSLRKEIADFLVISNYASGMTPDYQNVSITSPEAYRYFIEGEKAWKNEDLVNAESNYLKAIASDPDYFAALGTLCLLYRSMKMGAEALKTWDLLSSKKYKFSPRDQASMNMLHAMLFEPYEECVKYTRNLLEIDDHQPTTYGDLAAYYNFLGEYDQAIVVSKEGIKIVKEWNSIHIWGSYLYTGLAYAYHKTHQYKKEKKLYRKAERIFPGDFSLTASQLVLALTTGEEEKAGKLIDLLTRIAPPSFPEGELETRLAEYHSSAGKLDEAESYYRKACDLNPEKTLYLNNLAYFLFDNKRNIPEGFRIIEKALWTDPGSSIYLDTKGWGLYRSGRYQESLNMLLKADSCRILYRPGLAQHLDTVRMAVAAMNKQ